MAKIERRDFLKISAFTMSSLIVGTTLTGMVKKVNPQNFKKVDFNHWITLMENGDIKVVVSRSEMGQGVRTSMAAILADELEVDMEHIVIEQGKGDPKYGDQNTDGSKSVRVLYDTLRTAAATVRTMLVTAGARVWNIPESDCYAKDKMVHNNRGSKTLSYGELAESASKLPLPTKVSLKSKKDFKYIGTKLKNADINEIITGKAVFGIDKEVPGMLYAAVMRCPVTDGKAISFNANKAMSIPGVKKVIEIKQIESPFSPKGGIAVIATNTWTAFKARDLLEVKWDYGKNSSYNSSDFTAKMSASVKKKGEVLKNIGDTEQAFKTAEITHEASFNLPHLAHATMEPPNAVAHVKFGSCEVWAPTQDPQTARREVAKFLGIKPESVVINVTFLGGGFGRKSKPDYILEAVALSRDMGVPVQVVWTREDDIQHDYYHTVSAQYLKAGMDKNGKVNSLLYRTAFPTIGSTFKKGADTPASNELNQGFLNLPFDIANVSCEVAKTNNHVRIGWLRAVCNNFHSFAVNVFVNQLAEKAKMDPVDFRLQLVGSDRKLETLLPDVHLDTQRYKNVLQKVAKNAKWGRKLPAGKGMGIAVHYSFYSYVAQVVEVTIKEDEIKVDKVYCVIDCGTYVNKDAVIAQMEGGIIFGLSIAKYGKITATKGIIDQNNFSGYQLVRMLESPEIHVEVIDIEDKPTGVGEPGVPPFAPALISAIHSVTGKWHTDLPLIQV